MLLDKLKKKFGINTKPIDKIIDSGVKTDLHRQIETQPLVYDVCIGAVFDHPKDSQWMHKQFKLMNLHYKKAFSAAWYAIQYNMKYYYNHKIREKQISDMFMIERNKHTIDAFKICKNFENNIYRADNDQTCECKPKQIAIKEDIVTTFGLSIMMENFMLFNNLRFDTLEYGTGTSTPFGGDRALQASVGSVSILQEGVAIPYGTEARHGAPVLASTATNNIAEIGIKDSLSTKLYSRSVFPAGKIIDHTKDFDAYSVLHIAQLKSF